MTKRTTIEPSRAPRIAAVLAFAACASGAFSAGAVEVFVNGVKVTGSLKDQQFPSAEVRFDAQGNVHIHAPGYNVEVIKPAAAPPPAPAKKVWMVVNVTAPGHYKVAAQANGTAVAEIPASSQQYVKDITEHLKPGANGMLFTFYPQPDAPVTAPVDAVDILIGEGHQAPDGTLTISKVLATVKRKSGRPSAEAVPIRFELSAAP